MDLDLGGNRRGGGDASLACERRKRLAKIRDSVMRVCDCSLGGA